MMSSLYEDKIDCFLEAALLKNVVLISKGVLYQINCWFDYNFSLGKKKNTILFYLYYVLVSLCRIYFQKSSQKNCD